MREPFYKSWQAHILLQHMDGRNFQLLSYIQTVNQVAVLPQPMLHCYLLREPPKTTMYIKKIAVKNTFYPYSLHFFPASCCWRGSSLYSLLYLEQKETEIFIYLFIFSVPEQQLMNC